MREVSRVATERRLLLSHGEACQILSALQSTAHLAGDIAELGVASGASAKLIAMHAGVRIVHLFDTIDGLPAPNSVDGRRFQHGEFKSQLESVKAYLGSFENVPFHAGLFPATVASVVGRSFSFVHLDADLNESTLAGLEFFYPRMVRDGIVISHDYLSADGVESGLQRVLSRQTGTPHGTGERLPVHGLEALTKGILVAAGTVRIGPKARGRGMLAINAAGANDSSSIKRPFGCQVLI